VQLESQEIFEIINEMVFYYMSQEEEQDFAKYIIRHIINNFSSNPTNIGKLGWLLHDSLYFNIRKHKVFEYFDEFVNFSSKNTETKTKIKQYYEICKWIDDKLNLRKIPEDNIAKRLKIVEKYSKDLISKNIHSFNNNSDFDLSFIREDEINLEDLICKLLENYEKPTSLNNTPDLLKVPIEEPKFSLTESPILPKSAEESKITSENHSPLEKPSSVQEKSEMSISSMTSKSQRKTKKSPDTSKVIKSKKKKTLNYLEIMDQVFENNKGNYFDTDPETLLIKEMEQRLNNLQNTIDSFDKDKSKLQYKIDELDYKKRTLVDENERLINQMKNIIGENVDKNMPLFSTLLVHHKK